MTNRALYYIAVRFLYVLLVALAPDAVNAKVFHTVNYDPSEFDHIETYRSQAALTIEQVQQIPKSEWEASTKNDYLNFGYTTDSIWLKFHIKNVSAEDKLILRIAYPSLDYLDTYQVDADGKIVSRSFLGDRRPRSQQYIQSNEILVPLTIPHDARHTMYLRVSGQGGIQLPLSLLSRDEMVRISSGIDWLNVQSGVAVAAIIAMLVLWRVHRNRTYLYYGAFVGTLTLFVNGYYNMAIPDLLFWLGENAPSATLSALLKSPDTHHALIPVLFAAACVTSALLFKSIFRVEQDTESRNRPFNLIAYFAIASIPVTLTTSYQYALYYMYAYVMLLTAAAFATLAKRFWDRPQTFRTDGFFSICLAVMLLSFTLNTLNEMNWLGAGNVPEFRNGMLVGTYFQALLLGVATIIHLTRSEKEILQSRIQLDNSQKLSGLGEFAGGVIHEIRNPMTPISVLASKLPDVPVSKKADFALEGHRQVRRIFSILDGLEGMSGSRKFTFQNHVDLASVISDARRDIAHKLESIELEVSCNAPTIQASPVHLSQAISNLISNAADALSECDITEKRIAINATATPNNVYITIADNGPGIPEEQKEKLFSPFFTTKGRGKGMGFGMAIVRQIIQRHAGSIRVDSRLGQGTSFEIRLPINLVDAVPGR